MRTFDDRLALNFNQERLVSNLILLFADIRMAFGAAQSDVLAMVIRRGAIQIGLGALSGLPLALALGRLLQSRLYQAGASDPILTGATLLLASCALAAAFLPARRASALNSVQALRRE